MSPLGSQQICVHHVKSACQALLGAPWYVFSKFASSMLCMWKAGGTQDAQRKMHEASDVTRIGRYIQALYPEIALLLL